MTVADVTLSTVARSASAIAIAVAALRTKHPGLGRRGGATRCQEHLRLWPALRLPSSPDRRSARAAERGRHQTIPRRGRT